MVGSRGKAPRRFYFVEDFAMAQYEHLPIYKAAFDLQVYFEGIVQEDQAGGR